MRRVAGTGLWFPNGISNNETDLLIRMSIHNPSPAVTRGAAWEGAVLVGKGGN